MTLYPVVLPLSEADPALSGKERLARLSRIAREALRLSAETSGVTVGELAKDEDDVPLPSNGIHWSVSHKPSCVAAVVSNEPIGIDVEEIGPRDEAIYALVGSDEEWELGGVWSTGTTPTSWSSFAIAALSSPSSKTATMCNGSLQTDFEHRKRCEGLWLTPTRTTSPR
jgi:hypothetical protein